MIPLRKLGPFEVSAISLGCMNLSHAYGVAPPDAEAAKLLHHALDSGVTMLDTAALYGGGSNETLIGRHVMHRRSEFLLASKCVLGIDNGRRYLDGSPAAIAMSIDRSLERLRTDHIDLMYLHRADPRVPIADMVGALVVAKEAGKIGAIGLSEMSAATIRRAHAVHPIAAVQSEYSAWVRNPEVAVLDTCDALGIGFVAFSPLGRGMFAGAVRSHDFEDKDIRRAMPRFQSPNFERNLALVSQYDAIAAAAGLAPAQLALQWLLSRRPSVVAIPGTRSIAHLDEDLAAAGCPPSTAAIGDVDRLFASVRPAGPRYSAASQAEIETELLPGEELA